MCTIVVAIFMISSTTTSQHIFNDTSSSDIYIYYVYGKKEKEEPELLEIRLRAAFILLLENHNIAQEFSIKACLNIL